MTASTQLNRCAAHGNDGLGARPREKTLHRGEWVALLRLEAIRLSCATTTVIAQCLAAIFFSHDLGMGRHCCRSRRGSAVGRQETFKLRRTAYRPGLR